MTDTLIIPAIDSAAEIASLKSHPINVTNWAEYPLGPTTTFRIARMGERLAILFDVDEANPRAACTDDLQPVWEDSCVEFFCQLPGEEKYFNFEFNSRGVCVASSRLGQNEGVEFLTPEQLQSIRRTPKVGPASWSLLVEIPLQIISPDFHPRMQLKVNFYKCGDKCPSPHFLSYTPIPLPRPCFHCPQFFSPALIL